jgi:hypothetical protein
MKDGTRVSCIELCEFSQRIDYLANEVLAMDRPTRESDSEDNEWNPYDSSDRNQETEKEDFTHSVHKTVHHQYWTKLEDGELHVEDEHMGEREAGHHPYNEFEYGEFFSCNCGERFWDKESARDHLLKSNQTDQ